MKTLLITFLLATTVAVAEVPSLINYQGRLTGPGGAPASGTKNFALKIYDAATDGTLLYSEDVGAITLGEGGVYSFRFGASGTSNTLVTETIGTGSDSVLYQKVLSNTPVVAGSVSVSDGTYTWSQSAGSSNEDDFNAAFSTNLNRITVNYFAGAPNDGRQIEVTYRYGATGIVGALSSGSGHWLQLSIDGQIQATRERVLAVPFALYAGRLAGEKPIKNKYYTEVFNGLGYRESEKTIQGNSGHPAVFIKVPANTSKLHSLDIYKMELAGPAGDLLYPMIEIIKWKDNGQQQEQKVIYTKENDPISRTAKSTINFPIDLTLDTEGLYFIRCTNTIVYSNNPGGGQQPFNTYLGHFPKLRYSE